MFLFALLLAFLAPFFWRVFWKSFDEIENAEDRLLATMPKIVGDILVGLVLAGVIALGLYKLAEVPIEIAAVVAVIIPAVMLRSPMDTFENRIITKICGRVSGGLRPLTPPTIVKNT
jgi:ABC-type bacteriocin/lantibiotic exporter with double-glycine peptidase domain